MNKIRLAVLFGGVSSEYEVSCVSASSVLDNLDKDKYEIYKIGITKDGRWFLTMADTAQIKDGRWADRKDNISAVISPDRGCRGLLLLKERETETCGCGNHGCLEQYASATGIARVTKKYLEEHDDETVLRNTPELTAKAIFDAAKLGDEVAIKMVDETAKILAKGLSLVACVVNPQVFVIGGGMSKAGDFLIEQVQKYYQEYAFHACKNTFFKLADLGNDAGIYGCVRMIIK